MKYYYLNDEKKPQGPYSQSELLAFKESGLITNDTLAAAAGDAKWRPLSQLLSGNTDECSTWNNELGFCPRCGHKLEGSSVPETCPHCSKSIHGAGRGLWYAFVYALKNAFNYTGRATRTEFWGFYLFSYIFTLAVNEVTGLYTRAKQAETERVLQEMIESDKHLEDIMAVLVDFLSDPTVISVQAFSILFSLAIFIPTLSVTARRLHDTGRSIISLIIGTLSYGVCVLSLVLIGAYCLNNIELIVNDDFIFEGTPLMMYMFTLCVSFGILFLSSLYIFIMMLLPSKPGSNKYGPSTLFPRI